MNMQQLLHYYDMVTVPRCSNTLAKALHYIKQLHIVINNETNLITISIVWGNITKRQGSK